jgi:D-lactate dehydrogenase
MPTVVVFEAQPWERTPLERALSGVTVRFAAEPLTAASVALAADAEVVSIFIRSHVDAGLLAALPRLRLVATRSTGVDHVDLAACRARGVRVANVPHYGENTVAEHTFALILMLARRIRDAMQRTAAGDFAAEGLAGFDLYGKTLGVVGAGSIGLHVIRIGRGFGMQVVAHDPREVPLLAEVLGFRYLGLDELFATANVITLHVPESPATHHLVNRERLARVQPGTLLVNTARGGVVDTAALLRALDEGRLAGAGLDVLEGEEHLAEEAQLLRGSPSAETLRTLVVGNALLRRPDVVFTPHIAFNSREALARILETTVDNVRGFLAGDVRNAVV